MHFLLQKPKHFSVQPMWPMEENTIKSKSWPGPSKCRGNVMLRLAWLWRVARQMQQSFGSEINWVTNYETRGSYGESWDITVTKRKWVKSTYPCVFSTNILIISLDRAWCEVRKSAHTWLHFPFAGHDLLLMQEFPRFEFSYFTPLIFCYI